MAMPDRLAGMNRRKALALARELDCYIMTVKGTGEIRVSHSLIPKAVTINGRRKDCGRKLTCWLKELMLRLTVSDTQKAA